MEQNKPLTDHIDDEEPLSLLQSNADIKHTHDVSSIKKPEITEAMAKTSASVPSPSSTNNVDIVRNHEVQYTMISSDQNPYSSTDKSSTQLYGLYTDILNFDSETCSIGTSTYQTTKKFQGFYCNICTGYFKLHKTLVKHYNDRHGCNYLEENTHYKSLKELTNFLLNKQKTSYYTLINTSTKTSNSDYINSDKYYKCNFLKNNMRTCPAYIIVKVKSKGNINVRYLLEHNHKPDWSSVSVHPLLKTKLIKQIQDNIPIDEIYNIILNTFNEDDIRKDSIITKHYLYYLKDVHRASLRHCQDDKNNTKQILIEKKPSDINVFAYKDLCSTNYNSCLESNDFVICFNTKPMSLWFQQFGKKGVLMDSTHSTTKYGLLLVVLLVINENQRGVPFLFVLTNSEREVALKFCFSKFKLSLEESPIPDYVMTDCYMGFYNSWSQVFGQSNHLFCEYHILKCWIKQLDRYCSDNKSKKRILNMLAYLQTITSEEKFNNVYNEILPTIKNENEKFWEYFTKRYGDNKAKWALYNRLEAPYNTNNISETWFSKFKRVYLKSNIRSRVDDLLLKLRSCVENDKKRNSINTHVFSIQNMSFKQKEARKLHKTSFELDEENIDPITSSHFRYNKQYDIYLKKEPCKFGCNPECNLCRVCRHEVTCSCLSFVKKKFLCKHIHLIIRLHVGCYPQQYARDKDKFKNEQNKISNIIHSDDMRSNSNLKQIDYGGDYDSECSGTGLDLEEFKKEISSKCSEAKRTIETELVPTHNLKRYKEIICNKVENILSIIKNTLKKDRLSYIENSIDFTLKRLQQYDDKDSLFDIPHLMVRRKGVPQNTLEKNKYENSNWALSSDRSNRGRKKKEKLRIDHECCKQCFLEIGPETRLICSICFETFHKDCVIGYVPLSTSKWQCGKCELMYS